MTKDKNILYPQPMLDRVNYDKLDESLLSLTDLEYETLQNCGDFLEKLEQTLLKTKIIQVPELVVAHLSCYLGATATIYNGCSSKDLGSRITNLLKQHAELSLSEFSRYLSNSNASTQSSLLNELRENTPGSIVVQTMRLGRIIIDMMGDLSINRGNFLEKQKDFFCPQNEFVSFLIPLINEQHEKWQEDLDGLSINYAINQLTTQIGWLVGYFSYLDKQPNPNSYLEYSAPCISLYMDHTEKLLQIIDARQRS